MDFGFLYAVRIPQPLDHGLSPELSRHLPQVGHTRSIDYSKLLCQLNSCRGIVATISTEFVFQATRSLCDGRIKGLSIAMHLAEMVHGIRQ